MTGLGDEKYSSYLNMKFYGILIMLILIANLFHLWVYA